MIKVHTEQRIPVKLWLDDIEESAMQQAKNLANLPFAYKHIAIMPDAHTGYGMPIGGVLAAEGVVIPNAVGVDIGCGMQLGKLNISIPNRSTLYRIMEAVRALIPVGRNHHDEPQAEALMPCSPVSDVIRPLYEPALKQLGTLGGGNHFIEFQKDADGGFYVMVHSGSRNLGYKVANHHNKIAKGLNKKWMSSVPKEYDLAFLPMGDPSLRDYMRDMLYCTAFARASRRRMMAQILNCVKQESPTAVYTEAFDVAHNYAAFEEHFGRKVIVHRKGAIAAHEGSIGIIPGTQGSCSYIVRGKGNINSFCSASHGAGRKMSRTRAKLDLDLSTEQDQLDSIGVVHSVRNVSNLDEAPGAYKDISTVMANQADLVDIVTELTPLGTIKG